MVKTLHVERTIKKARLVVEARVRKKAEQR